MPLYTDLFREAWGEHPTRLVQDGFQVGRREVEQLTDAWHVRLEAADGQKDARDIRPLISHHGERDLHLFGVRAPDGAVRARALPLLLAFDGLMVADPVADVVAMVGRSQQDQAAVALQDIVREVAELAPLIDSSIIRVTPLRPELAHPARATVLKAMGVDPSMLVFTNFVEAAVASDEEPMLGAYLDKVAELFDAFLLPPPAVSTAEAAAREVQTLAAAVVEVSWQLAVCAQEPGADVALRAGLEEHLFGEIVRVTGDDTLTSARQARARTRHFARIHAGEFPVIDGRELSAADAVFVREDDSFADYRDQLYGALDQYEDAVSGGLDRYVAQEQFESRMRGAGKDLRRQASASSFAARLRGLSVPIGVGAVISVLGGDLPATVKAAGAAVPPIAGLVDDWVRGSAARRRTAIIGRYCAILGSGHRSTS
jgi:hypothetical protein